MADNCEELALYYEAQAKLIRVTHKYMHDNEFLDWRPTHATSLGELKKKANDLRANIGAEATDEILEIISDLEERLYQFGH